MKPFDPAGEYTPEEVKAALAGVSGTRQLSYRYERLDKDNQYIEDIDSIQSCTIANNALADIKRTAKFDILDTGSINYLQDRIKPHVRLTMPEEKSYRDVVSALDPAAWWPLDDLSTQDTQAGAVFVAADNSYNTLATAYDVDTQGAASGVTGITADVVTGSTTLRSEYWVRRATTPTKPIVFEAYGGSNMALSFGYEIYYCPTSTGESKTLVSSGTVAGTKSAYYYLNFPKQGYFFGRVFALSSTIGRASFTAMNITRFEDSSGNGRYPASEYYYSTQPVAGLLNDGGRAAYEDRGFSTEIITDAAMPMFSTEEGLAANFWLKSTPLVGGNNYASMRVTTESNYRLYFMFNHDESTTAINLIYRIFYNEDSASLYTGTIDIPEALVQSGTTHMYTFSIDFVSKEFVVYLDGVERGRIAMASEAVELFRAKNVAQLRAYLSPDGSAVLDDVSFYAKPLPSSQTREMYTTGSGSAAGKRRGYVEWPQGVFVLSSPTRKMINGNTVVRSVEGYDQLVTLKEDSFDYRYSVVQGATYTQSVLNVLQSSQPLKSIKLTDKEITTTGVGTKITSDNSATAVPYNWGYIGTDFVYSSIDFSMSAALSFTVDTANVIQFGIRAEPLNDYFFEISNNQINATFNGSIKYSSGAYSSTTHKYLRVRNNSGTVYWETSSDGANWQIFYTMVSVSFAGQAAKPFIWVRNNTVPSVTFNMSDFKALALGKVNADIETSTKTLPAAMEWDAGTPKLDIINDLLGAINYTSATYSEDGVFTSRAYLSPQNRTAQFRYATDSSSVLVGDVDQTVDVFGVPNKWVLIVSDPDRPALVGTYVNTDPMSPTSTVSRGRTIVDFRTEQSAADQVTLDAQAARLAFEASQVYEVIEFNTALMPIHQDSDVYELIIDGLAVNNKYAEHSWSMTLANGSPMRHRARRVVSV